jgi:flavin-binding protein dodecin
MSEHTYRVTEIVGSSPEGVDAAVRNAIDRASRTLRHLDWFEVTQIRGAIADGRIAHWQVGLKVGFRIEDVEDAQATGDTGGTE